MGSFDVLPAGRFLRPYHDLCLATTVYMANLSAIWHEACITTRLFARWIADLCGNSPDQPPANR